MENSSSDIYLGFITYGPATAKYLSFFLPSLFSQSRIVKILAVDNTENKENENFSFINKNYPEVGLLWAGTNLGFARAYNLMINKALAANAKYFIAVNPDMVLENDFVAELAKALESGEKIGAVAPKILKWDFENNQKTDLIDSYGLYITKEHRFSDIRQGEKDDPTVKEPGEVFGFTGAAVIFNLKALRDVAYFNGRSNEYFDELMFMYKEDCDLSYRLRLAGWKILFAPRAVAYHNRTASPKGENNFNIILNRRNKSRQVKKWSFLNHWILLVKFWHLPFSFKVSFATVWYQLKCLGFAIFFEPYLISDLWKIRKIRHLIKNKSQALKVRVKIQEIEKFMQ